LDKALSVIRRAILFVGVVIVPMMILAGCSSSSPRFRSSAPSGVVTSEEEEDEIRFAAKIREEEVREDDIRVDIKSARRKLGATKSRPNSLAEPTPVGLSRDKMLLEVVSYLGVPYQFGGASENGMDCSGFASTVYANAVRRTLPRLTRDQFRVGIEVLKYELQFGDLVFFNTTGRSPSHVGIYIEDDLFVHASVTSGVTISSLESTYYKRRFVGARRIVN